MEGPFFLLILGVVLIVPLAYGIGQYNGFIGLRNQISEAWSNIDTELKRRHELIPNLVAVVRGYAAHEREIMDRVTELRSRCVANQGKPTEQAVDENQLAQAVNGLLAVVENYPELKADAHFLELQRELANTENRIQAARRFYNGNVRDYLNKRESFPTNVIAGWFHFGPENFLEIESAMREAPKVAL